VNRSTTTMGAPHLGQRHSGCTVGAVEVSDVFRGSGVESGEAPWQQGGAPSVSEEAEVADADETLGEQMK